MYIFTVIIYAKNIYILYTYQKKDKKTQFVKQQLFVCAVVWRRNAKIPAEALGQCVYEGPSTLPCLCCEQNLTPAQCLGVPPNA